MRGINGIVFKAPPEVFPPPSPKINEETPPHHLSKQMPVPKFKVPAPGSALTTDSGADPAPAASRLPSPDAVQLEQRVNWCDTRIPSGTGPLQAAP